MLSVRAERACFVTLCLLLSQACGSEPSATTVGTAPCSEVESMWVPSEVTGGSRRVRILQSGMVCGFGTVSAGPRLRTLCPWSLSMVGRVRGVIISQP